MPIFKKRRLSTQVETSGISQLVEDLMVRYSIQRKPFERRWYDNNFFDDGYHFRYLSRRTGKIVDLSHTARMRSPRRAIPKASRQIRGVANLLLQLDPHPAIYPERVLKSNYPNITDPATGQESDVMYRAALEIAKETAKKVGHWIEDEWDYQEIKDKLVHMIILAAKHGVSYLELWPDAVEERNKSKVFDAFDIFLDGTLTEIYDSPSITKAVPTLISKIKANENFDEAQRMKINPDNKFASSEVKQAYMQARFGAGMEKDSQATIILKETFMKEYICDENIARIKKQGGEEVLEGKNKGDMIIRHIFSTSNGWLLDEYVNLSEYPFVDYRFEPGMIYQVPLIERFIPINKSLDIAVSRVEGYANTMVTGVYQKRKGENFQVANMPGGQVIEYEQTPLTQMQPTSVPGFMFNFIQLLESFIEEQGASTSTLGKLPEGVKSGKAIESIKATEFANLKIASDMFRKTVKRLTERLIELSAENLINPKEVVVLDEGDANYFDVIGEKAAERREEAGLPVPEDTVIIKKNHKVRIEVESGLGYTVEGKKQTMQDIANYVLQLAEVQMVSPEQVQVMIKRFLEIFQFGSTAEFMDAFEEGKVPEEATDDQTDKIKLAVLEVLKDAGLVGPGSEEKQIQTNKVAIAEAVKDLGGA